MLRLWRSFIHSLNAIFLSRCHFLCSSTHCGRKELEELEELEEIEEIEELEDDDETLEPEPVSPDPDPVVTEEDEDVEEVEELDELDESNGRMRKLLRGMRKHSARARPTVP